MKNKVAIVRVWGGIGNQLFIYAFAKLLSLRYHIPVFLEKRTGFTNDGYHRKYKLNRFNISIETVAIYYTLFPLVNKKNVLKKIIFPNVVLFEEDLSNALVQIPMDFFSGFSKSVIYFQGYWQSLNFKDIRNELLNDLAFYVESRPDFSFYKEKIEASANSVAIHFRRIEYNFLLSLDYYQEAIKYFCNNTVSPDFYIFSDDIEWCKKNNDTSKYNFCFIENFEDELYELKLMSLCSNFIIANSTFSWWGAWLSNNENKIVIMPEGYINISMNGQIVFLEG
ncbi:MAG: alpha-1,2-fucosyltransferase [Tannerella sp.]|jgi:hypothetical protein|nr:alpha-1,2-fucosyltransferase [Tannerella sp.]